MEADRQRNEAERQRMEQMFQWMQSFGERMGQPLPPELFPPPPPPATTPVSLPSLPSALYLPCLLLSLVLCFTLNLVSHMQSLLLCAESIGGFE